MIGWPLALPDLRHITAQWNYQETPSNPVVSSQAASGEQLLRKRFSTIPKKVSFTIPLLDRDQVDALNDFYTNTLNYSLAFSAADPVRKIEVEWQFLAPPQFEPLGNDYWVAHLQMLLTP